MEKNSFTTDDFLGGKIKLRQPENGYRATSDAVLLAASVEAKPGQNVLDIGTGSGAVGLCLLARCPGIAVTGIEIQPEMAELAIHNAGLNSLESSFRVICGDIRSKKIEDVPTGFFDWVVTNPPFILEDQPSPDKIRDIAHRESACSLEEWIKNALRYVRPRGFFAMINRADRIAEICTLLSPKLGGIRIIPVWTKENGPAKRIIVIGRKGVRSPAVLEKGIVLMRSDGTRTPEAEAVMRGGAPVFF